MGTTRNTVGTTVMSSVANNMINDVVRARDNGSVITINCSDKIMTIPEAQLDSLIGQLCRISYERARAQKLRGLETS